MNNHFLYKLVQFILNEEESGRALTPDNFSDLLAVSSLELARQVVKVYEDGQDVTDIIERLKTSDTLTFTVGEANLPSDYYRKSYLLIGDINAEFVTDAEFAKRKGSVLKAPSASYPIVKIAGGKVIVSPASITTGDFNYIKKPETPFYDYYYNALGRVVYLEEDASHTLLADEEGRQGESTGATVTSSSKELDWNDNEKLIIVGMICSKAGVNIGEAGIVEYAEMLKQQQA